MGEQIHETIYLLVMEDAVRRLGVAADALRQVRANPSNANNFAGCEVAAIQIRKVCEALVLGVTACHMIDDKHVVSDRKWRPKDAFQELEQINEHPLPVPVEVILDHAGPGQHHVVPQSKPMPFSTLSRIYGICGDLLHVPTLRQVVKGRLPEFDVPLLLDWIGGFSALVRGHALMLPKREIVMLCIWNGSFETKPEVYRLDAVGDSTLDLDKLCEFELL